MATFGSDLSSTQRNKLEKLSTPTGVDFFLPLDIVMESWVAKNVKTTIAITGGYGIIYLRKIKLLQKLYVGVNNILQLRLSNQLYYS